jgi:hypothetical protein
MMGRSLPGASGKEPELTSARPGASDPVGPRKPPGGRRQCRLGVNGLHPAAFGQGDEAAGGDDDVVENGDAATQLADQHLPRDRGNHTVGWTSVERS